MKKYPLKRSVIITANKLVYILFVIIIASSCNTEKSTVIPNEEAMTEVKINISEIAFEASSNIGNKSAESYASSFENNTQTNTIELDHGFQMVASLTEITPSGTKSGNIVEKKAAIVQNSMAAGVNYKIIVYDSDGVYVDERTYTRGQENNTTNFMLFGGRSYTFIIYSINTTGSVPATVFANPANKTLATTTVPVNGSNNFLYARKDILLANNSTTVIDNIVLKHKLSQIISTIDATATGYNITAISSNLSPNSPNAIIDLSNGTIERSGQSTNPQISFTTLGALTATSTANNINVDPATSITYTISSLTIGPLTLTNITPFQNLFISPGVKYNATLTIVPQDEFLTHNGLSAARINGVIWMRHNVGANFNADPDVPSSEIFGNYYQWGRNVSVANPIALTVNANWVSNNPSATAWNLGTEAAPIKTNNDPCPAGYRVPTRAETDNLIESVVATNIGNFTAGSFQYTSAKVLTSKRKRSVKLTLPAQGWFNVSGSSYANYAPVTLASRGSLGVYYNSYASGVNISGFTFSNSSFTRNNANGNNSFRSQSKNIRCVGF